MIYSQILTITPDTVAQGQILDIEVTAENIDFSQGTNVVTIKQGGFEEYVPNTAISPTTLLLNHTFNTDYTIGNYDLSIWNTTSDITLSKEDAIYVKPDLTVASMDSISPDSAKQGDNITITLYGFNTNFDKADNTVYLINSSKKINAAGTNIIDSVTLEAQFFFTYAHPAGVYSIYAKNDLDGTLTIANTFELIEGPDVPAITSISPDTLTQGQTLDIEVTAENIDFSQGTNVVTIKQGGFEEYVPNTAISPTTLLLNHTFNTDYTIGNYDLSIWNTTSDITLSKEDAIYVKPDLTVASMDSISPDSAKQGDNITITLYGFNTNFDKADNTVYLINSSKKINAAGTNIIDSVTLEAQFFFTYAHPAGVYSIYAKNDLDGTLTIANTFELIEGPDVPAITSISPDTLTQGQTLDIEVTAENIDFSQGTNVVILKQNNTEIYMNSSSALNSNTLKTNISISNNSPTGIYSLKIWNTAFDITLLENQTIVKESAVYLKSAVTGIENNFTATNKALIFPNPASKFFVIRRQYNTLHIFDIQGKMVYETQNEQLIDISNLNKGIYLIHIKTGNEITTQKLIVK